MNSPIVEYRTINTLRCDIASDDRKHSSNRNTKVDVWITRLWRQLSEIQPNIHVPYSTLHNTVVRTSKIKFDRAYLALHTTIPSSAPHSLTRAPPLAPLCTAHVLWTTPKKTHIVFLTDAMKRTCIPRVLSQFSKHPLRMAFALRISKLSYLN